MTIVFSCPQCRKRLKAPDDAVGRSSRCPDCGTPVACPEPGADGGGPGESSDDPRSRRLRAAERDESIRELVSGQRKLLICVLLHAVGYLGLMMTGAALDLRSSEPVILVIGIMAFAMTLAAEIAGLIYTYILSSRLFNVSAAVVLALMVLVPCLALFVLLAINQRVTQTLEDHGYEVGFFGVKRSRA